MTHNSIASQTQADIRVTGQIDAFFNRFHIGTLLHQCGVRKRHGHSVRSLIQAIFTLPFLGQNFYRGIVVNPDQSFGKDAAYEILKGVRHNWRKVLLTLARRIFSIINRLTDDRRESVLILDDSTYDRSRSKAVELLSRVYDHSRGKFIKGFRMLALCWSDGVSCLPVDFALLSSANAQKRLCQSRKPMDRRCCAHQRRGEAVAKATDHLRDMFNRAMKAGVTARYLLMDSWFTMPATVSCLADLMPVIGMVKKIRTVHYRFQGRPMDLMTIYRRLKKRRGRAKILASAIVTLSSGQVCKLAFVRDRHSGAWLAILSTDIDLTAEDIVRIYGKRWDIGVSSKGHIIQPVKVRPGLKGSDPVAWEAPWRESKMVKPSDKLFRKETMQGCRPQRTVNADVASLHAIPVAETVYNARRQQEPFETSPMRRFSPAGYQRWHVARDYVSTGETLGVRRRNLVEEALSITVSGKWERRRQGGGSGCSTVDRCAAKRTGRKGPEPVNAPFDCSEAGVK